MDTAIKLVVFAMSMIFVRGIELYGETDLVEPVNVGNDREFSILQLAEIVKKMFAEKSLTIEHMPMPKDDPKQRRPDLTKAKALLQGWSPKVPLEEGLVKMCDWLKTQLS
jgi:nucleoside-diphosphate-sugar epimerase